MKKKPQECNHIEEIRENIDRIDNELIKLISERFSYAKEIVRFKNSTESIIAKERYEAVLQNRRTQAINNGLNPDVVENMYRTMMNYFIEEEIRIFENNKKD